MIPSVKKQCLLCIWLDGGDWKEYGRAVCNCPDEITISNGRCKQRSVGSQVMEGLKDFLEAKP